MSVRQEPKPRRAGPWGEGDRHKEPEECLVGGDCEKLLFSEHRGVSEQRLAVASKQQL